MFSKTTHWRSHFEKHILKIIQLKPYSYCHSHNPKEIKLITRLQLVLSQLFSSYFTVQATQTKNDRTGWNQNINPITLDQWHHYNKIFPLLKYLPWWYLEVFCFIQQMAISFLPKSWLIVKYDMAIYHNFFNFC